MSFLVVEECPDKGPDLGWGSEGGGRGVPTPGSDSGVVLLLGTSSKVVSDVGSGSVVQCLQLRTGATPPPEILMYRPIPGPVE